MVNLQIVTSVPSPHLIEFFNYIAQNSRLLNLKLLYLSSKSPERMGYIPVIKHEHKIFVERRFSSIPYNLDVGEIFKELKYKDSLYIVCGYASITFQIVMYYLNINERSWLFWGEKLRSKLNTSHKLLLKPLEGARAILGIGNLATWMYQEIFNKPVYNLPYFIDLGRFFDIPLRERDGETQSLRFLYIGSLIHRKGVDLLIRAFGCLREKYRDIELHIVGDGPLRQELVDIIPEASRPSVFFHSSVEWDEIHKSYLLGDVFVFPTRYDGWGMVINEALASGLPVITTYNAGAAYDSLSDNYNGFLCPADNVNSLIEKMECFIEHKDIAYKMGLRARETMKDWTLQKGMERFESIITDIML